jgi:subtilase family serine protease
MIKRLFLVAVVFVSTAITGVTAVQRQSPAPDRVDHPPDVVVARHDRSPRLRDLPAAAPTAVDRAEREPLWRRIARHTSNLIADPVVQNTPTVTLVPAPTTSIEGVGNVNGVLPPDTNAAVGPNHVVQWVNLSFAVYSKGGATTPPALIYGPAAGNTLWQGFGGACESTNTGDPIVRYDRLADRWVMTQLAVPNSFLGLLFSPFYECIAVSATPDPLGAYYRYEFTFNKLNDYPKFGVWSDGYYMTMNQFTSISLQWAGQGVVAFDRGRMLAGQPASAIYYDLASVDMNLGGMLPADLDGPQPPAGSPEYFVQVDDDAWGYAPDQLQIWKFHADWNNPSASSFARASTVPTAAFDSDMCGFSRNCIPQPGTTTRVDAIADRLMYRLQYRNFGSYDTLVVNHTVDVDATDHAGIRWYEVRNPGSSPFIYQQGTYAPDGNHRWMGSAAMDGTGNIALGFSVSGAVTSPSIRYTGRLASDPPNVMTLGEADLMVGSGSQTHGSGRWGDYSALLVDPVDDCTFWYTQEYYAVTSEFGWQTRIGSFGLPGCSGTPAPTLPMVTIAASAATGSEAGPTSGAFTVTRIGDTSDPLTLSYVAGGTAGAGADYIALPGVVTIDAGASTAVIPVVPIDDTLVEPNETVVVSLTANPAFVIGSGPATVTITSDDAPPDLVVTAVTGPLIAGAGTMITLGDTTKNQGGGLSQPSSTAFFLTKDFTIDASDINLGSRSVPGLAAGASDSASTAFEVPSGTPTATYYVFAKADVGSTNPESNENNNLRRGSTLAVGADLVVSALTGPAAAATSSTISVSDTTKNQGGGAAEATSVTSFYLSSNILFDTADVLLGSRPVSALAAGMVDSSVTSLTIPADTPAGTYYVLAKADGGGSVLETQESNNVKYSAGMKIGPDLIETNVIVPANAGEGAGLVVSETVKNQGPGSAGPSTTAFYLSTNGSFDTSDQLLGTRTVPPLAAGATSAASTSVTIPAGTATGIYYVLVKADANNDVGESVETNNLSYGSTRVGPDLTVSSLTSVSTAVAGSTISVSDTTKSVGGGNAPPSTTRYYLSANITFDVSDVALGSRAVSALAAGASDSGSASIVVPSGTAAGAYYILAVCDGDAVVTETNETNNTRALFIKITVGG